MVKKKVQGNEFIVKKEKVDKSGCELGVKRQCELLGISRASVYYKKRGLSDKKKVLLKKIEETYEKKPFYGSRKIKVQLNSEGYEAGRYLVRKLRKMLGLKTIFPKRFLSKPRKENPVYPYLLKNLDITRINQVWCSDITYVLTEAGYVYVVAVIDWRSRYVLAWEVSKSLSSEFCKEVMKKALRTTCPEYFNSDQGSQYTDKRFIEILKGKGIKISMDGKGRALDNIIAERLWRSYKYEEVYLKSYKGLENCKYETDKYFKFFNNERFHQTLGYKTPAEVYFGSEVIRKAG